MACHVEAGTPDANVCAVQCLNATVSRLDGTHELRCTYEAIISYNVKLGDDGKIVLQYADLPSMCYNLL